MQLVDRWHEAERIRAYLTALKNGVESGRFQPPDEKKFGAWFAWACRFADSIDPVAGGPLPEGKPPAPQNMAAAELDLTSATRAVVNKLGVLDTDALWKQKQNRIREACAGRFGAVWNEITRVLEGLGYDVSKRESLYDWQ